MIGRSLADGLHGVGSFLLTGCSESVAVRSYVGSVFPYGCQVILVVEVAPGVGGSLMHDLCPW